MWTPQLSFQPTARIKHEWNEQLSLGCSLRFKFVFCSGFCFSPALSRKFFLPLRAEELFSVKCQNRWEREWVHKRSWRLLAVNVTRDSEVDAANIVSDTVHIVCHHLSLRPQAEELIQTANQLPCSLRRWVSYLPNYCTIPLGGAS